MEYKYNYIIFSGNSQSFYKHNHNDEDEDVVVRYYDGLLSKENGIVNFLYKLHTSPKTNRLFRLPFKSLWNSLYFREKINNHKKMCFVFSCELYYLSKYRYFEYLKRKYPGCKLLFKFTDMVDLVKTRFDDFSLEYLKKTFDYVLSYEIFDVVKYGLVYHCNITKGIEQQKSVKANLTPENDVVFVGEAKDRLGKILACYDLFKRNGLKCDFTIVFAPKEYREKYTDIDWRDEWIPFEKVLSKIDNSKCILDIVQNKAIGINARGLRALSYNKKLVSNCLGVKYLRCYDDASIQYFEDVSDIDVSKIANSDLKDYRFKQLSPSINSIAFYESLLSGKNPFEFYDGLMDLKRLLKDAEESYVEKQIA